MNPQILDAMRSPFGVPAHPALFLILLVVTWVLHILAVHVMLGSMMLSLIGSFRSEARWRRLAAVMLNTAKVAVSVAIVLGVAPLLFLQTIYDPFWYVSNVLSARWVISFIGILLAAYYALYHRYFASQHGESNSGRASLAISLALLLIAGFIMHVLSAQALRPELWMAWYAPDGHIDPSGASLHEFNFGRFAYFISLSLPVTGAWLSAYRRYGASSSTDGTGYWPWLATLERRLLTGGGLLALLFYGCWMKTLPDTARFYLDTPWPYFGALTTLLLAALPWLIKAEPADFKTAMITAVAMLIIATSREALRIGMLYGSHGYDLFAYKINFDAYGTLLFVLTLLLVGGSVLGYLLSLCWHAGRTDAIYVASPGVKRLGRWSLMALVVWIAQYFLFGFITLLA